MNFKKGFIYFSGAVLVTSATAYAAYAYHKQSEVVEFNPPHGQYCITETPSAGLRALAGSTSNNSSQIQTEQNSDKTGMVWIPGGEFVMGDKDPSFPDAHPVHKVRVSGFWMDKYVVTNADFARFVKATGYKTVAERPLDPKEFPGYTKEMLAPGSIIFTPPPSHVPLNDHRKWWAWSVGASWQHPQGPQSDIKNKANYPVVQIAYEDAEAYAKWVGKRLPSEAEWEFAARGGLEEKLFPWGDELKPDGRFMANTWQGSFPEENTAEDGFEDLAPVGKFPANGYGLYDMAGNVWQWVSDWYHPTYYHEISQGGVSENPRGPEASFDPAEPKVKKKVQRGGSFLCTDQYCSRYRTGTRGKGDITSGAPHVGFRLVQDR
ncbi:formylglycine-generating enzyme family protein [Bdellovibrio sp. HCB274]|uniref:formylglycine-generating enzyme family protein n=1 Tax=Bdellovibrio sp. HCB274 TaxID=3394361 RepID=UPI0039B58247